MTPLITVISIFVFLLVILLIQMYRYPRKEHGPKKQRELFDQFTEANLHTANNVEIAFGIIRNGLFFSNTESTEITRFVTTGDFQSYPGIINERLKKLIKKDACVCSKILYQSNKTAKFFLYTCLIDDYVIELKEPISELTELEAKDLLRDDLILFKNVFTKLDVY